MYWSLTPSSILYHITQLASSCPLLSNTPQDKSSSLALLQHSYQNRLQKYCNQPHCGLPHLPPSSKRALLTLGVYIRLEILAMLVGP